MAMKFHKQLDRYAVHEGALTQDKKWVHQTWMWPSHPQAYYNGSETGGSALYIAKATAKFNPLDGTAHTQTHTFLCAPWFVTYR